MSLTASCISICVATGRPGARQLDQGSDGLAATVSRGSPDRLHQRGKETQMDTMALTHPAAPRKLRITLTAGQPATAAARREVRAAIGAWNVPLDPSAAVLLTRDLSTKARKHEGRKPIELVTSCAYRHLRVDVYATSPATAMDPGAPAGAEAGPAMMLLASLSTSWGYYRTPTGRAGY